MNEDLQTSLTLPGWVQYIESWMICITFIKRNSFAYASIENVQPGSQACTIFSRAVYVLVTVLSAIHEKYGWGFDVHIDDNVEHLRCTSLLACQS